VLKKSAKNVISQERQILKKSFPVKGKTFSHVGRISTHIKSLLKKLNVDDEIARRAAIISFEAEMNICAYAEQGRINLVVMPDRIEISVQDVGQGIEDIDLAMEEGFSTATEEIWRLGFGAGMGLSNMKKFSDSFRITSEIGKGTHVEMVIFIRRET
jgi:serine/threonine-protein kinase RsbT